MLLKLLSQSKRDMMKIIELEIKDVRGIRDLLLKPEGNNLVVWGPNGSGKSAVVDALDFLLTGQISRLTGSGTRGITLNKHGKHIDSKPANVVVRAKVQLRGMSEPTEIKRCLEDHSYLEHDEQAWQYLEPVVNLAKQGIHVLTRREILKYITADASTRAKGIQELLDISEIEDIREAFVRVKNNIYRDSKEAQRAVETIKSAINGTIDETSFSEDIVLQAVNKSRSVLRGSTISVLSPAELKKDLAPPTAISSNKVVNTELIEKDIKEIISVVSPENQALIEAHDKKLRELVATIHSKPQLLKDISRLKFTKQGIELIDESGDCPLCDTPWPHGELQEYLSNRVSTSELAGEQEQRIKELTTKISNIVNKIVGSIQRVVQFMRSEGAEDISLQLETWLSNLQILSGLLGNVIEKYPGTGFSSEQVMRMLAPENINELLKRVRSLINSKYPSATPEQSAWDTLTRLEEHLKSLETAERILRTEELSCKRAVTLLDTFENARDTILGDLYKEIEDQFVSLYRQLHGADEDKFVATIKPDGAGVDMMVDFYGRGAYPPQALHSEGHQDSMGLCLYLALAEKLTKGIMDLIVLDDVVMSVDSDHRRGLCRLLTNCFKDRQFLITTHDRTWTNQLRTEGVVNLRRTVELYNWHVDTGPQVNYEVDLWDRIEGDLQRNDVPGAAARLRRGSEDFFGGVCNAIHGQVTYKLDAHWELGDFLPAAVKQYRWLLKQAKRSASSWDNRENLEMLKDVDSTAEAIFARAEAEKWAVNANVHYNNWLNANEKDFRPVIEAFKDLYTLFMCNNEECRSIFHLVTKEQIPVAVHCSCGKVNWNLVEKQETI